CSDIHLEPYEKRCRVRMRLDGKLVERFIIEKEKFPSYVNKIKIMSNLDIAEKRLPQDGRIFFKTGDQQIDIRVSILPILHGEKVVLRLLGSDASDIDINLLGFDEEQMRNYRNGYNQANGIILISGPTGSGKTTTLYATLKELNKLTRNIVTIEDPIEYTLEGINQVQLREKIGLDFPTTLRTFLRQDPNIIMVGEIRDVDTAKVATRAAMTGHLVLSTIHTNSAIGVISRLIEMGVSPYLLADTLNTAVAQRLLRILCPVCKNPISLEKDHVHYNELKSRGIESYYEAVGCSDCHNTGYRGRKAIYEVIPVNHQVSKMIKRNEIDQIAGLMQEKNIKLLSDSAMELLSSGETSLEETNPYINHD
ncbi:MAG: GspE/PulE family protein, partial [Cyclobacteriaceae bacterium]